MNAPPTYILYALRTPTRSIAGSVAAASSTTGGPRSIAFCPPPFLLAISLHLEVREQPLAPALAAEAALLVAAEGRARVELVVRVRPHHARAEALRDPEALRSLVGPDAGRQAVHRVVRLLDRL